MLLLIFTSFVITHPVDIDQLNISRVLAFCSSEKSFTLHYLDTKNKRLNLYHHWMDKEQGVFLNIDSHKGLRLLQQAEKTYVVQASAKIYLRVGMVSDTGTVVFYEQVQSIKDLVGRRKLTNASLHEQGKIFLFFRIETHIIIHLPTTATCLPQKAMPNCV